MYIFIPYKSGNKHIELKKSKKNQPKTNKQEKEKKHIHKQFLKNNKLSSLGTIWHLFLSAISRPSLTSVRALVMPHSLYST